jgi:hypothetical protein
VEFEILFLCQRSWNGDLGTEGGGSAAEKLKTLGVYSAAGADL